METRQILHHDGAELSYWLSRVEGAKHTLVMLHGVASNHTRWSEFVSTTSLTSSWNLLTLDLRGHGDSMFHGRINRRRWVADLHAIIEKEKLPSLAHRIRLMNWQAYCAIPKFGNVSIQGWRGAL